MFRYLLALSCVVSYCVNGGVIQQDSAENVISTDQPSSETPVTFKPNNFKTGLKLHKIGNSYYYVQKSLWGTYHQGVQFCNYHGMELVSIETEEENKQLFNLLKSYYGEGRHGLWTSGTALVNDKHEFYWLSTGKKLQYLGWRQGEPNNIGNYEKCLVANFDKDTDNDSLLWNDMDCNEGSALICEKPLPESPLNDFMKDEVQSSLELQQFEGSYYYIENILQANYSNAEQFCNNLNMKPVYIETEEERQYLYTQLKPYFGKASNDIWASGTTLDIKKHDFYSLSSEEIVELAGWSVYTTDNEDNEQCLQLTYDPVGDDTLNFDNQDCSLSKHLICEKNTTEHIWDIGVDENGRIILVDIANSVKFLNFKNIR